MSWFKRLFKKKIVVNVVKTHHHYAVNKDGKLVRVKTKTLSVSYENGEGAIDSWIETLDDKKLNELLVSNEGNRYIYNLIKSELNRRRFFFL